MLSGWKNWNLPVGVLYLGAHLKVLPATVDHYRETWGRELGQDMPDWRRSQIESGRQQSFKLLCLFQMETLLFEHRNELRVPFY